MASDYRDPCKHFAGTRTTRRHFFERISDGIYGTALATLLSRDLYGGLGPLAAGSTDNSGLPPGHRRFYDLKPRSPHFPSETKAVIHLFMNGGPSHVDLLDPKPTLDRNHGQTHSTAGGQTDVDRTGKLMRSPFEFKQYGKSGIWVSDLLPSLAQHVDDISVIRSMHTVHFNHEQALLMVHSGRAIAGRPSLGSWVTFGLGSENQNMPAYVVLDDPLGLPINRLWNWQSGFLPPLYQGTRLRSVGSPILDLNPDASRSPAAITAERDLISKLDQIHKRSRPNQLQLDARIASYELAAKLQLEASSGPGSVRGKSSHTGDVRRWERANRLVRTTLPDGPASCRARGSLHPALHRWADLGQPRSPRDGNACRCSTHRPTHRRPASGPQATGLVRQYTRHLGR